MVGRIHWSHVYRYLVAYPAHIGAQCLLVPLSFPYEQFLTNTQDSSKDTRTIGLCIELGAIYESVSWKKNVISSKSLIIVTLANIDQERRKAGWQSIFPEIPEVYIKKKKGGWRGSLLIIGN